MAHPTEHFKVSILQAGTRRNRILVALFVALPKMKMATVTRLTAEEALQKLDGKTGLPAKLARVGIQQLGLEPGALVFASRKGQGRVPAHRVTLWRVLQRAFSGGVRYARRLAKLLLERQVPKPRPTPQQKASTLCLSKYFPIRRRAPS